MSISSCPLPSPSYQRLKIELGEYQANKALNAYSSTNRELPDVNSQDMTKLIDFWKATHGFENETPQQAKRRILAQFGKKGTHSIVHPQFYAKAKDAVRFYNAMKGKSLLGVISGQNGGTTSIYQIKSEDYFPIDSEGFRILHPQIVDGQEDENIVDYSIGATNPSSDRPKFEVIIKTYLNKRKDLGDRVRELQAKRREEKDNAKKLELSNQIDSLEEQIDNIQSEIDIIKGLDSVSNLIPLLNEDLDEISEFINNQSLASPDSVTFDQLTYARKILRSWEAVSNHSNPDHPFLDNFERSVPEITSKLDEINARTKVLSAMVYQIALEKVRRSVSQQRGRNITKEELISPITDTNFLAANTLALSRQEPLLLQAFAEKLKHIELISFSEYSRDEKEISTLLDQALPFLMRLNKDEPFSIFKQEVKHNGVSYETGNIVFRYSQNYFNTAAELSRDAHFAKDDRSEKYKVLFDWQRENNFFIDPLRLDDEDYISEIESHYGVRGLDELVQKARKRYNEYLEDLQSHKDLIEARTDISGAEKSELIEEFEVKFDPRYYFEYSQNNVRKQIAGVIVYPTSRYVQTIPRRFYKDGSLTSHYDDKYQIIQSNDAIYKLHDKMISLLNTYRKFVPYEVGQEIQINSIPHLSKTMFELYGEQGLMSTANSLIDQLRKSNTVNDVASTTYQMVDPLTNAIIPSLGFKVSFDTDNIIWQKVNDRIMELRAKGQEVDKKMRLQFFYEERDKLSKSKSWDLGKVMKVYSFNALQYKHKARAEDLMTWQKWIFDEKAKELNSNFGKTLYDPSGNPILDEKNMLKNYKDALDHTYNFFLNMPIRDNEGITGKKIYDKQEKEEKAKLEEIISNARNSMQSGVITQEEGEEIITKAEKKLDALGSLFTWSKAGDNLLRYFQMKGMGWNIMGGIVNVSFGMISNIITAADGREFNEKNLWQSFRIALASVSNNYTFNQTKKLKTRMFIDSVKLRNLMDKNNILKQASHEMFKSSIGDQTTNSSTSIARRLKFISPYNAQQRSEYLVQSIILSSMLFADRNKVTDLNGNERPLWDALDTEGNWNYEEFGVQEDWEYNGSKMLNFLARVESVIAEAHGDYTNELRVKKSILGRALSQFRTWMFEGYANRFETEKFDEVRGYERKGRYRSFDRGSLTIAGALLGTSIAPIVGTAIGATIANVGARFMDINNGNEMNDFQSVIFHTKQLLRRMLITQNIGSMNLEMEYDSSKGFTEVDAANMRKNMTEMAIYVYLYSFGMILKMLAGDDDDDEWKLVTNYLINQGNRLETDLLFYSNPLEARKLTKQIAPVLSLMEDLQSWGDAVYRQFDGRPDLMSGPFKGENILIKESMEMIPFGVQYYRTRKTFNYIFEK